MKTVLRSSFSLCLCICLLLLPCHATSAATKAEIDTMQAHLPDEWPDAPEITSEAAILVDIDTDTIHTQRMRQAPCILPAQLS